jgi:O-antigen/teichoic acid export membrane protein
LPHRITGPQDALHKLQDDYRDAVWSLGVPGLGQLALLPLLVATLTARELGALAVIEAVMTPAATLGMMGLKFAYLYRYPQETPSVRGRLFATCLMLGCLLSVVTGMLVALPLMIAGVWQTAGFSEPVMRQPLLLVLALVTTTVHGMLLTWWRAERALAGVTGATWAQLVGQVLVGGAAIGPAGWGVDGLFVGQVVGTLAAIGLLVRGIRRTAPAAVGDWRPDVAEARRLLAYGWPLTLGLLVRYGMDSIARLLLARLVSLEAAGAWLVVSRVIGLFDVLVSNPLLMAWGGLMHHVLRLPQASGVLRAVASRVLTGSTLAALGLLVAHQALLGWLAEGYGSGHAWLFLWLLAGKWLVVVKSPLTSGVYLTGDTAWAGRNHLLALGLFLVLGPTLAVWQDAEGLAAAILLSTLVPAILLWHQSHRLVAQTLTGASVAGCLLMTLLAIGWCALVAT